MMCIVGVAPVLRQATTMAGYLDDLGPLVPGMMIGIADISKMDPDVRTRVEVACRRYGYEMVGPPLV